MIIFIALVVSVGVLLVFPLFEKEGLDFIHLDYVIDERKQLKQKKANVVLIIKELDFDYETGKLSKEDYKHLRDKYEGEAVKTMRNLEQAEKLWETHVNKVEKQLKLEEARYNG